jgi:hypothetical protein
VSPAPSSAAKSAMLDERTGVRVLVIHGDTIEVLITVKAYPAISNKYGEVVCVAGIRMDTPRPEWVRLFPVAFRDMPFDQRFRKYDVIRLEADRHSGDARPETYRPNVDLVEVVGHLDTKRGWAKRRPFVEPLVVDSMCELLERQRRDRTSLGVFRPADVEEFTIDPDTASWDSGKQAIADQPSLFFASKKGARKDPVPVSLPLPVRRPAVSRTPPVEHRLGTRGGVSKVAVCRARATRQDPATILRRDVPVRP